MASYLIFMICYFWQNVIYNNDMSKNENKINITYILALKQRWSTYIIPCTEMHMILKLTMLLTKTEYKKWLKNSFHIKTFYTTILNLKNLILEKWSWLIVGDISYQKGWFLMLTIFCKEGQTYTFLNFIRLLRICIW